MKIIKTANYKKALINPLYGNPEESREDAPNLFQQLKNAVEMGDQNQILILKSKLKRLDPLTYNDEEINRTLQMMTSSNVPPQQNNDTPF